VDDNLLSVAFRWQAAVAALLVVASVYLVVRLKEVGALIVVGVPVTVIVARSGTSDVSPLLGVFMFGWLALLATPYVLGAIALRQRYRDVGVYLLEHGARPHPELKGEALVAAADAGQLELVRALLDRGANVDACGLYGHTAVHIARVNKREAVVALLLDRGADPEHRCR
jgi:hypothetical protein